MNDQERVKKAIADRVVPEPVIASDEDIRRYSFASMPIVVNNRMERNEIRFAPRTMAREYIFPRNNSERFGWDQLTLPETESEQNPMTFMNEYLQYAEAIMGARPAMFGIGRTLPETAVLEPPPEMPRPSKDILQRFQVAEQDVADMRSELASEAESLLGYSVLRKRLGIHSPLTTALMKLKIEPFDSKTVDEYKKQMLTYARNEAARLDIAEGINPKSWQARVASWQTSDLQRYPKPVPEYALEKALQIKKACPEVQFSIEELTVVPDPFLIAVLDKVRRYIEVWDEPKFEGAP